MAHIDWESLPFTETELRSAWEGKQYVAQVLECLGVDFNQQQVKNLGKLLGLPPLKKWTPHYSLDDLRDAWNTSLTAKDAAKLLGTSNTASFRKRAGEIGLPPKPELASTSRTFTQKEFTQVWESAGSLDEAARQLALPESNKSYIQLNNIAKAYGLPLKGREVVVAATGEDSSTIIADWIDWHRREYRISPTSSEIGQASKQVKELIRADYSVPSIKNGVFRWTLSLRTSGYRPSADMIKQYAFEYERATNARVQYNLQRGAEVASQIDALSRGARIEERRW